MISVLALVAAVLAGVAAGAAIWFAASSVASFELRMVLSSIGFASASLFTFVQMAELLDRMIK